MQTLSPATVEETELQNLSEIEIVLLRQFLSENLQSFVEKNLIPECKNRSVDFSSDIREPGKKCF